MSFDFSNYVRLDIPEGRVKKITRKADGVVLWKAGYVNQVPISKDENGNIYNGTGYKNKYRIRSGGAEAATNTASHTGFIPAKGGDVVRIGGATLNMDTTNNAINVYDSSYNCLGQVVENYYEAGYGIFAQTAYQNYTWDDGFESPAGVFNWTVPPNAGIAFIRVTSYTNGDGSKMIVTVNEEIE